MTLDDNTVPVARETFAIAIQYWAGDEARAMRVARLIADIEGEPRSDVMVAFCRRFDCEWTSLAERTAQYVSHRFPVMMMQSDRRKVGHPDGANGLWSGSVELLANMWREGRARPSIFTVEHDGCPLSRDWVDRLSAEHMRALGAGKRVSGCMMEPRPQHGLTAHVNGTLMLHASMWFDRPSIQVTPDGDAWDIYHGNVFMSECQPTNLIRNIYGATDWTPGVLEALARDTVWLSSTKDDSALEWAEGTLVTR